MPPKVEAVVLAVVLVGAWIVMENSHRIDMTADDASRWVTVATCQPAPVGSRYSAGSAIAADSENTDILAAAGGGNGSDACGGSYRNYSATTMNAVSAVP
jgi:hypothetical protein